VGSAGAGDVQPQPGRRPLRDRLLARTGLDHHRSDQAAAPTWPGPDRTRALSSADVEQLLTRDDLPIRERTLWRMLYETAARAGEVLALDVPDLDLRNR
jgi:integrase